MNIITKSILFSVFLCVSNLLFSHARLESTIPEHKTVVTISPTTVVFNFNRPMRLIKVTLTDRNNEVLKLKYLGKKYNLEHNIVLEDINPEYYLVKWSSLGKDGHKMSGEFSFMYHVDNMVHDESLELMYQSFIFKTSELTD